MSAEHTDKPRAVIVISSHVARGSVGNRAAVFALETLGFPVWAVPTVILPWHPGHSRATRIVPPVDQFKAMMADLERAPWLGEVGARAFGLSRRGGPGRGRRLAGRRGPGEDAAARSTYATR
ncbi:MAG: hypothetical protein QM754_20835 [Tepidisphaeraceae bacterium]